MYYIVSEYLYKNGDTEGGVQKLDEVVKKIPKSKDYITVPEAYALFGISKETLCS
jgi:hypothetical protein